MPSQNREKRPIGSEFLRYFAVSGIGLATDLTVLIGLTELFGVPYLLSAGIGFCLGAVVVYRLSIGWVFQARTLRDKPANEFLIFLSIGVIGLLLNQVVLFIGTDTLHAHYMASKAVAIGFVFTWNYSARKALLFTKEAREAHP